MTALNEITIRCSRWGEHRAAFTAFYADAPCIHGYGDTPGAALASLLDKVSDPEWLEIQRAIVIPQTDAMTL